MMWYGIAGIVMAYVGVAVGFMHDLDRIGRTYVLEPRFWSLFSVALLWPVTFWMYNFMPSFVAWTYKHCYKEME